MTRACEHPANEDLCERLEQIAEFLEAQDATPFRVAAYRRAATTLCELSRPVSEIFETGGVEALEALPTIGRSIASLIREYAQTGHITLLDRLKGDVSAEEVLASLPGIGPKLAHRIHEKLGISNLEQLECACSDGSLAELPGFGARRVEAISATVAARLAGRPRTRAHLRPSVEALLDVDREYCEGARRGVLPRIAPKRFNPEGRAWLPILHTHREGWEMTALFSNSERAHRLGHTHDWVVIFSDRERDGEHDQATVVDDRSGGRNRRTVRGREMEVDALRAQEAG